MLNCGYVDKIQLCISYSVASDQLMESAAPGDTVSSPVSKEVQHGAKLDSLKSAIERMKGVVAPQPKIRLHSISSEYPRYDFVQNHMPILKYLDCKSCHLSGLVLCSIR